MEAFIADVFTAFDVLEFTPLPLELVAVVFELVPSTLTEPRIPSYVAFIFPVFAIEASSFIRELNSFRSAINC